MIIRLKFWLMGWYSLTEFYWTESSIVENFTDDNLYNKKTRHIGSRWISATVLVVRLSCVPWLIEDSERLQL